MISGECILALLIGSESLIGGEGHGESIDDHFKFRDYCLVGCSFTIIYILKNIYFKYNPEEEWHALNEPNFPGACIWVMLHGPLGLFLLGTSVGLKLLFEQVHFAENLRSGHRPEPWNGLF